MTFEDMQDSVVPYLVGAVAIFVLLLTLHQVLRDAVRHGASLKADYAERNETNWRCNAAHGPRERDDCIALRSSPSSKEASPLLASIDLRTQ